MLDFLTSKKVHGWTDKVGKPFKNLPHLPQGLVDFLVQIAPWFVAIAGVFSLFGSLSSLRWALGRNPARRWVDEFAGLNSSYYVIMAVVQLAMAYLALEAFKPLKERKIKGWLLLFWSNILSLVQGIVGFIYSGGSPVTLVLGVALGLYVLYEVRSEYNGKAKKAEAKAEKAE